MVYARAKDLAEALRHNMSAHPSGGRELAGWEWWALAGTFVALIAYLGAVAGSIIGGALRGFDAFVMGTVAGLLVGTAASIWLSACSRRTVRLTRRARGAAVGVCAVYLVCVAAQTIRVSVGLMTAEPTVPMLAGLLPGPTFYLLTVFVDTLKPALLDSSYSAGVIIVTAGALNALLVYASGAVYRLMGMAAAARRAYVSVYRPD